MKLLLGTLFILCVSFTFSQKGEVYSYTFSGSIDSSFVKQLETESMDVKGVTSAKAKYKIEKEKGEIILFTKKDDDQKDPYVFSPGEIKAIIIRHNLVPGQFIQLKTSK